jgi:hypothetical protein
MKERFDLRLIKVRSKTRDLHSGGSWRNTITAQLPCGRRQQVRGCWGGYRLKSHAAEGCFSRHPAARARGRAVHCVLLCSWRWGAAEEGADVSGSGHLARGGRVGPIRVLEFCLVVKARAALIKVLNCASPRVASCLLAGLCYSRPTSKGCT